MVDSQVIMYLISIHVNYGSPKNRLRETQGFLSCFIIILFYTQYIYIYLYIYRMIVFCLGGK